jgi:alpha-glucosidase (family GH31 glycosyl hydrolase)
MMRAMVLEFQDDPNTYNIEDQYMFGDAFLVAPIYQPSNKRTVYLPKGKWFDYWTGKEYEGPTILYIEPPLDMLPLYVKADSIIPMGPDMSYVGEKPFDPITLDIWLCSEAEFTTYDDEEVVRCSVKKEENKIVLKLDPSKKKYIAKFNKTGCPIKVSLNGADMIRLTSYREFEKSESGWYFDPSSIVCVKFNGQGNRIRLILQI